MRAGGADLSGYIMFLIQHDEIHAAEKKGCSWAVVSLRTDRLLTVKRLKFVKAV